MADKYDNNGSYNSSDFKRNTSQESGGPNGPGDHQDGEERVKLNDKADEYIRELLSEKIKLNNAKFPISLKLIDDEVTKIQVTGRVPARDNKYLDVYRDKATKVTVKVLVPLKEHPKFNFVGKLLGPKGNTMKQLQEETMCKMAVLGRGSMRDRQKEEELRNSLDPKYAHLSDELHVEIAAVAAPAEAHARIAYALAEVKKYLIPDPGQDMMPWQPPMDRAGRPAGPPGRPPPRTAPRMSGPPPPVGRGPPPKNKVASILDRARTAMDYNSYDDGYGASQEQQMRAPPRAPEQEFYYERAPERFYEDDSYYKEEPMREYKTSSSARDVGTRRPQPGAAPRHQPYQRTAPYQRPQNQRGGQRPTNKPSSGGGGWN